MNQNLFNRLFDIFLHFIQYSYWVDDNLNNNVYTSCFNLVILLVLQGSHQNASTTNSSVIQTNRCDQPKCGRPVDILERVAVENHVFHKSCFVCAICNSWLNHFNYCFVPDHDKFYCIQHYQDIENASFGLGEDIRHAMGIGPGVQQQFKFTPGVLSTYFIMPPSISYKSQSIICLIRKW